MRWLLAFSFVLHGATGVPGSGGSECVHLDKQTQRWVWEDENGREHEWHGKAPNGTRVSEGRWMPVISEEDIAKQAEVYRVAGVDDTVGSSLALILTCRHLRRPC